MQNYLLFWFIFKHVLCFVPMCLYFIVYSMYKLCCNAWIGEEHFEQIYHLEFSEIGSKGNFFLQQEGTVVLIVVLTIRKFYNLEIAYQVYHRLKKWGPTVLFFGKKTYYSFHLIVLLNLLLLFVMLR